MSIPLRAILPIGLVLCACFTDILGKQGPRQEKGPDIRGVIEKSMQVDGLRGMFLVEEQRFGRDDNLWVRVTDKTRILKLDGTDRKAARFEELDVGVRIKASGDGRVFDSKPGQIVAVEIVILPPEKRSK